MFVTTLFPKRASFGRRHAIFISAMRPFKKVCEFMMDQADPDDVTRLDTQMLRDIGLNPDDVVTIAGPDALRALTQRPFV